jgi:hypothetical protein
MTINELTPTQAQIDQLIAQYPALDAGGNHRTGQDTIAQLYALDDRDLGQEIATCRLYYREHSIGHDSVLAYTGKHFVEAWRRKTFAPEARVATSVSAGAMVCAAALEEREVRVIDDRYYVAINVLPPED